MSTHRSPGQESPVSGAEVVELPGPRITTRELASASRGLYAAHLRQLDDADRQLRFGLPMNDATIDRYVSGIDTDRDAILVVTFDSPIPVAAAHLAHGPGYVELAVSVLAGYRGRGLGSALFRHALTVCRRWNAYELFTHCWVGNRAMMALARKHGMRVIIQGAEADAYRAVA